MEREEVTEAPSFIPRKQEGINNSVRASNCPSSFLSPPHLVASAAVLFIERKFIMTLTQPAVPFVGTSEIRS